MKVVSTISELYALRLKYFDEQKEVALVPTMGALHAGHLSLLAAAKRSGASVWVSIFVNPAQFNNREDFEKYPLLPEQDLALLETAGCDVVFAPNEAEMYPLQALTGFSFGLLEHVMEGRHRPGHFAGVGLVVSKLFNLCRPHRAYFGLKDFQQFTIIRQLNLDLNFNIQIIGCPTLREPNGLAMSSRNLRLSATDRSNAGIIYRAFHAGVDAFNAGHSPQQVSTAVQQAIEQCPGATVEYVNVARARDLQYPQTFEKNVPVRIFAAVYLGGVRLIDNMALNHADDIFFH